MKNKHLHPKRAFYFVLSVLLLIVAGMTKLQAQNITFADANVKAICVANWDTDGDGELNQAEAAAVTSLDGMFMFDDEITTFDELSSFTGLTAIGEDEFNSCTSLTAISIPNAVTAIGNYAFSDCSSLTSITSYAFTPPTLGSNVFDNVLSALVVNVPCGTSALYQTANGWSDLSNYEEFVFDLCPITFVDNNAKAICVTHWDTNGDGELNYAEAAAVTNLGTHFKSTTITSFDELEYFTSLTSLPNTAFYGCTSLASITLPSSVSALGNGSFYNCTSLATMTVYAETPPTVGTNAFKNVPTSMVVHVSCGAYEAYHNANDWNVFSLPNPCPIIFADANVKALCVANWDTNGDGELSYAEAAAVTSLGYVFYYKTSISSFNELQYFTGLTSIGSYAFRGCSGLTSIEIPNSVTSIGSYAFYNCSGLTSMTVLAANPPTLGSNAFNNVNKGIPVYLSCGSVEAYATVYWGGFYNFIGFCGGTITVAANPAEGGTVTGGGTFGAGETCTVTATANEGYVFAFWTREGMVISTDAEYTFFVTNDMDLVAHFVLDANITFADANVKALCVANWDANGDGKLSYAEAAAVTNLGTVFRSKYNITSFDELQYFVRVTSIGYEAFYSCTGLTSIAIPNSVASIGSYAFDRCFRLTTIEIPNSVTSIGSYVFSGCSGLGQVVVDSGNMFYDSRDNCNAIIKTSTNELVVGCKNTAVPNSVTSIGSYAFYDCSHLTTIEIPNSVTSIGSYAFYYCSGLTTIEIPNSVTSIGSYAFYNCSRLTTIEIPNSVISIGDYAFCYCSGLEQIVVDSGNMFYDSRDNCNAIIKTSTNKLVVGCKNTAVPNSVTSIGSNAFRGCSGLTSIEIPNSVTSIGDYAFYYCSGLTSMTVLAANPPTLGSNAFYNVNKGIPVYLPCGSVEAYTAVNWGGFNNLNGLCGGTVTVVANPAEGGTVTDGGTFGVGETCTVTATANEGYAFAFWTREGMVVSTDAEYTFFVTNDMDLVAHFVLDANITFADAEVKALCVANWDTNGDGELSYAEAAAVTSLGDVFNFSLHWPPLSSFNELQYFIGLTSIDYDAFSGCGGLTSIKIPNSVISIGDGAFSSCSRLTSIEIPNSVISIGDDAFSGCSRLTSIEIPNSVTSIGSNVFNFCPGLAQMIVDSGNTVYDSRENCNAIINSSINELIAGCKNTIIPNSVTSIGDGAFYFCASLTSIEIPNSVTSIGDYAFGYCSGLTSITVLADDPPSLYGSFYDMNMEIPVYVLCGSVEAYTAANWGGFSNFIGLCGGTVTVAANPAEGGTVTGGGVFGADEPCTVTATTNDGYIFNLWTRNGKKVSTNTEYTFYVLDEMDLVAHFVLDANIAFADTIVKNICVANWDTNNDGELSYAEAATVSELGYVFSNDAMYGSTYASMITSFDELQYFTGLTSISNFAFSYCSGLTSIEIPSSVTSIGSRAFYGCTGLTSIEIPNSVTSIGSNAFSNCTNLTSIEIPNSVASISNGAFSDCSGLKQIIVDSGNTVYDSRENCNAIIETSTNKLVTGCKNTVIPNSVTSIGDKAFDGCSGLTSIEIPNSVTSIGNDAFYSCRNLISIEIPNSVTSIGNYAFCSCSGLTSITVYANNPPVLGNNTYTINMGIPVYVLCGSLETYIAANWGGFSNFVGFCGGTVSVAANPEEGGTVTGGGIVGADETCTVTATENENYTFANWTRDGTVVSADAEYTFYVSGDMNLVAQFVPNGNITFADANVKSICVDKWDTNGDGELSYAEAAVVTSLGEEFRFDTLISSFNELQCFIGLASIGNSAFSECSGLTSIEIPNSVTSIGSSAFSGCSGLTSIEIPSSVTSIGGYAFWYCSGLTSIEIPNSVTSIGDYAFWYCSGLEQIIVDAGNTVYDSRENCNAIINTTTNVLGLGCKNTVIPNSVTSIGSCAFFGCSGLISIEIPNSVTSIGYSAFENCTSLTSIEIPNSMISISSYTFSGCSGLTSITIHAEIPPTLGYGAFNNVNKSIPLYVPCGSSAAYQSAAYWNEFTNIQELCTQTQTITLSEGWNWFSTYIEVESYVAMLDMLKEGLGNNAMQIQSIQNMTEYDGGDWFGDLDDLGISNEQTYLIEMSTPCTVELQGMTANPANHVITINHGWNWIGFPSAEPMDVVEAFAGFEAEEDDQIMSQNSMTEFDGEEWFGDVETLEPGQGYMYYSNSLETKILIYQIGRKRGR